MERMKNMKETLMGCVQAQMSHLDTVDTKELGEVVDMIKDFSEAIYYCTITEAMEGKEKEGGREREKEYHYYTERYMPDYRMIDRPYGRMYYNGNSGNSGGGGNEMMYYNGDGSGSGNEMMYYNGNNSGRGNSSSSGNQSASSRGNNARGGGSRGFHEDWYEREMPFEMRDEREGRSHMSRKTYMESKEMHQDKNVKLKELEKYMQELSNDMVEMISDTSPEEKQLLEKRLAALSSKIGQLNG